MEDLEGDKGENRPLTYQRFFSHLSLASKQNGVVKKRLGKFRRGGLLFCERTVLIEFWIANRMCVKLFAGNKHMSLV